ncbi:MAG: electron transport complex subunit RsxC [Fusobacteriaceae bacterium]|nr:electron transport complex subunit RsxC [Fusobacteriaceae bacterium]MBN2839246.1 electron transport complex subunit RsxC [Fusobacteriaceae bacterium]
MSLFKFKGGIHPPENKKITENLEIENFKTPKFIYLPMLQHIGTPCEPVVKIGDRVLKGQIIGEVTGNMSVPIHSPISGIVKNIDILPFTLRGKVLTVVIENDFQDEWIQREGIKNYKEKSKEELINKIRNCGVVGLGGALFPTHIKLNVPQEKKIEYIIINASECEPYLNSDNRLSIEKAKEIVVGIEIAMHILGVNKVFIGIEDNKGEAIKEFENELKNKKNIELAILETKYPQGGEKQLIKAILNKQVPFGKLPLDYEVVVLNVTTAYWIYNSVINGYPLIEEIITVTGEAVKKPKNYRVLIGTLFQEILDETQTDRILVDRLISGGPMMGIAQYTENIPVIKGTSGILALTKEETQKYKRNNCISCGKCVEVCPMGLEPLLFAKFAQFEKWNEIKEHNLLECIECGSCQYVCPSNRPLVEGIRIGKAKIRSMSLK